MPLTEKQTLLAAFDDAFDHKWESFALVTKDLTEEEATYQHAAYADAELEEGWQDSGLKPGSILFHLVHMEYWYRYYIDTLDSIPDPAAALPSVDVVATLDTAMERLLSTRAALREKIASLDDNTFAVQLRGITVGEFCRMMIRHDTWHSAQIAVARRLYRTRHPA